MLGQAIEARQDKVARLGLNSVIGILDPTKSRTNFGGQSFGQSNAFLSTLSIRDFFHVHHVGQNEATTRSLLVPEHPCLILHLVRKYMLEEAPAPPRLELSNARRGWYCLYTLVTRYPALKGSDYCQHM